MELKSIILVGGPDSGKSNFLARLWLAFQSQKFSLISSTHPEDIKYIETIAAHLLQGKFAPRTEPTDVKRDFEISIQTVDESMSANIIVPDMYGEIWKKAVTTLEIPQKWLNTLRSSSGALLFVRVQSPVNVEPLDWVTTQGLIKSGLGDKDVNNELPTQVALVELLRFIEENILRFEKELPKVAVIISAWDLLHSDEAAEGPEKFLEKQFPLFSGRLKDCKTLDTKIFGSSIVGGDFQIDDFVNAYLEGKVDDSGYVVTSNINNEVVQHQDITLPIKWLLNSDL